MKKEPEAVWTDDQMFLMELVITCYWCSKEIVIFEQWLHPTNDSYLESAEQEIDQHGDYSVVCTVCGIPATYITRRVDGQNVETLTVNQFIDKYVKLYHEQEAEKVKR